MWITDETVGKIEIFSLHSMRRVELIENTQNFSYSSQDLYHTLFERLSSCQSDMFVQIKWGQHTAT